VHDRARQRRAEAVVREEVEFRDDLAKVGLRLPRRLFDADVVRLRVVADGVDDVARAEDLQLDRRMPSLQLEPVDADPPLMLQTPRVPLAEDGGNRDEDDHDERGERVPHAAMIEERRGPGRRIRVAFRRGGTPRRCRRRRLRSGAARGAYNPSMPKERFTAVVLSGHKGCAVEVPFDPERRWRVAPQKIRAGRNGFPVEAMLNGIPFDSFVVPRMKRFFLEIDDDLLDAAKVGVGDEVQISVEPRVVEAPAPKRVKNVLERVRKSCFAYDDVTEKESWGTPTFRVRDKIFVMYTDNHHDDGMIALWCNAAPGAQDALVRSNPDAFFKPPYVGPKGWLGIRLDRGLEWPVVESLIADAYRVTAAKTARSNTARRAGASQSSESASRRRPRRAS